MAMTLGFCLPDDCFFVTEVQARQRLNVVIHRINLLGVDIGAEIMKGCELFFGTERAGANFE